MPRGENLFTHDLHGTAVAGAIAAASDGVGMLKVAPEPACPLMQACWAASPGDRQATCDSYTLALALDYALGEGAQVINLLLERAAGSDPRGAGTGGPPARARWWWRRSGRPMRFRRGCRG